MRIRHGRRGDGAGIARIHRENSAHYVELAPELFMRPDEEGLVAFLEPTAADNTDAALLLVAEDDGELVGTLYARIVSPDESARFQSGSELREVQLLIDALGVLRARWRQGIASALVEAAEEWGRARGATVALCDTWHESPVSLPFWENRAGYDRRSVRMRKRL